MSSTLPSSLFATVSGARSFRRLRDAWGLLRNGGLRTAWNALRIRLWSRSRSIGLRRDITIPFPAPAAKTPVDVRPMRPNDDLSCIAEEPGLPDAVAWSRYSQRRMLAAEIPTCWVAVDAQGKVCYMQWLVAASENARVQTRWHGLFPKLEQNEALLEGAYTAETHRGLGIMSHAMARIAAEAAALGARYVITFVGETNVASLKGCEKSGFAPYIERRVRWTLFRRSVRFVPISSAPTAPPSRRTHTS